MQILHCSTRYFFHNQVSSTRCGRLHAPANYIWNADDDLAIDIPERLVAGTEIVRTNQRKSNQVFNLSHRLSSTSIASASVAPVRYTSSLGGFKVTRKQKHSLVFKSARARSKHYCSGVWSHGSFRQNRTGEDDNSRVDQHRCRLQRASSWKAA